MWDQFIPDGPLHPEDALAAAVAGLAVAGWARRDPKRWLIAVAVMALIVPMWRRGDEMFTAMADHPRTGVVVMIPAVIGAVAALTAWRLWTAIAMSGAALLTVWGIVPDTEMPLILGVLLGTAALGCPRLLRYRAAAALLLLPGIAAVVGTVGRPDRLDLALGLAAASALVAGAVAEVAQWAHARRSESGSASGNADDGGTIGHIVDDDRAGTHHRSFANPTAR